LVLFNNGYEKIPTSINQKIFSAILFNYFQNDQCNEQHNNIQYRYVSFFYLSKYFNHKLILIILLTNLKKYVSLLLIILHWNEKYWVTIWQINLLFCKIRIDNVIWRLMWYLAELYDLEFEWISWLIECIVFRSFEHEDLFSAFYIQKYIRQWLLFFRFNFFWCFFMKNIFKNILSLWNEWSISN
jgi:hypothetical protein